MILFMTLNLLIQIGGSSVGYQMLNEESRKYFNRAFLSSCTALSFYALSETSHLQRMKDFSKIDDEAKLVEYLKTKNSETLANSFLGMVRLWVPTIENPNTVNAFITETPEEIYNSNKAPVMDAMFSFNSKVNCSEWIHWNRLRSQVI